MIAYNVTNTRLFLTCAWRMIVKVRFNRRARKPLTVVETKQPGGGDLYGCQLQQIGAQVKNAVDQLGDNVSHHVRQVRTSVLSVNFNRP